MKVIIDCREHDLYSKVETMEKDASVEFSKETLHLGDIMLKRGDQDVLLIERKSVSDLIASIKDGRYKEQSFRLLNSASIAPHNIVYIIEGPTTNLPSVTKKMVYGAITSIAFLKGCSVLRTWSVGETAELILNMARKIEKDWAEFPASTAPKPLSSSPPPILEEVAAGIEQSCDAAVETEGGAVQSMPQQAYAHAIKKVKKENITAENIGEIMLSQIPGVGSQPAIEIMKKYKNIAGLIDALREDPKCLDGFQVEGAGGKKRRMNSTAVAKIREYFVGPLHI